MSGRDPIIQLGTMYGYQSHVSSALLFQALIAFVRL